MMNQDVESRELERAAGQVIESLKSASVVVVVTPLEDRYAAVCYEEAKLPESTPKKLRPAKAPFRQTGKAGIGATPDEALRDLMLWREQDRD